MAYDPAVSTALVYVRQSRTEKERLTDSLSLEVQEAACRNLPAVKACGEVVVFRDPNKSGRKARKVFEALTERIKEGEVAVVAYYDQSRAFRNTRLFLEFTALLSEPAYRDIEVVPVHGSPFQRTPIGVLQSTVLAAVNQFEAEMAGLKIREAYRSLNGKGVSTGAAPYGYRYIGAERVAGALQPNPETAPVVRRIFEMYANGTRPREIAATLYREDIPSNARAGSDPANWKADTITAMLSNISYIGQTYSGSRRDKTGDIIPADWPAIVDAGLYQRVKDRMTRLTPSPSKYTRTAKPKGAPKKPQNPKTANPFVFRGLLWCAECDRRFVAQRQHGIARYFCGSRETTHPCAAGVHSIHESEFLPWVDDLMAGLERGQLEALLRKEYGARLRKPLIKKQDAQAAIDSLEREMQALDMLLRKGRMTEKQYDAELADLRRRQAVYKQQLEEQPNPKELEGLAQRWRAVDKNGSHDDHDRHDLLSALFEKLHVRAGMVDGKIEAGIYGCTPRADRVNRVRLLLGTALDYASDKGPGAARNVERRGRDSNSRWASDP